MTVSKQVKTQTGMKEYDHQKWNKQRNFLRFLLRHIAFSLLVKLEKVEGLENIPATGSALIYINHIAFVDPIAVLYVIPRNIVPLAKVEVYNYPIIGIFPKIWGVIPVQRQGFDRRALQQALAVLKAQEIVLVAPEGTRHQALEEAKEGLAYLATRTSAPLIPCAVADTVGYPSWRYSKRWSGPGAKIKFGRAFRFNCDIRHPRSDLLRQMTDEAMYILASMLPTHLRGYYQDLTRVSQDTIEWL